MLDFRTNRTRQEKVERKVWKIIKSLLLLTGNRSIIMVNNMKRGDFMKSLSEIKMMEGLGIVAKKQCSKEETEEYRKLMREKKRLPDNVVFANEDKTQFTKVVEPDHDELMEKLLIKQTHYAKITKNCMVTFLALAGAGIVIALIGVINTFSAFSNISSLIK